MSEIDVTFSFDQQDHTIGNLLRSVLLNDRNVVFAAYKSPHPLFRTVELRVQTVDDSFTSRMALETAIEEVVEQIDAFDVVFNESLVA